MRGFLSLIRSHSKKKKNPFLLQLELESFSLSQDLCLRTSRSDKLGTFCISDAHIKGEAKISPSSRGRAPASALNVTLLDSRNTLINAHRAQLGWRNTPVKWVFLLMDCLIMPKCRSNFGVILVTTVTVHRKCVTSQLIEDLRQHWDL